MLETRVTLIIVIHKYRCTANLTLCMNTFTYCTLQTYDFNRIKIYNVTMMWKTRVALVIVVCMYRCIVNLTLCMNILMYLANIDDFNRIWIYNHFVSVHPSRYNSQGYSTSQTSITYIPTSLYKCC